MSPRRFHFLPVAPLRYLLFIASARLCGSGATQSSHSAQSSSLFLRTRWYAPTRTKLHDSVEPQLPRLYRAKHNSLLLHHARSPLRDGETACSTGFSIRPGTGPAGIKRGTNCSCSNTLISIAVIIFMCVVHLCNSRIFDMSRENIFILLSSFFLIIQNFIHMYIKYFYVKNWSVLIRCFEIWNNRLSLHFVCSDWENEEGTRRLFREKVDCTLYQEEHIVPSWKILSTERRKLRYTHLLMHKSFFDLSIFCCICLCLVVLKLVVINL